MFRNDNDKKLYFLYFLYFLFLLFFAKTGKFDSFNKKLNFNLVNINNIITQKTDLCKTELFALL